MKAFLKNFSVQALRPGRQYAYSEGTNSVTVAGSVAGDINYLEIKGNTSQNGTPNYNSYAKINIAGKNGLYLSVSDGTTTKSLTIPSSLTLNGSVIKLRFAKIDNVCDYLAVDKVNNLVTYNQKVGYVKFTGEIHYDLYNYGVTNGVCLYNTEFNSSLARPKGLCTYCNKVGSYYSSNSIWINTVGNSLETHSYIFWIGILDLLGFTDENTRIQDFKNWLTARENLNEPAEVYYTLGTNVKTYDITNTTLGASLLALQSVSGNMVISANGVDLGASRMGIMSAKTVAKFVTPQFNRRNI